MRSLSLFLLAALLPAWAQKGEDAPRKWTDEDRIELIRGLSAEFATVKALLPRSKKTLKLGSDGKYDKITWREAGDEYGAVARIGDQVQITKVDVDSDSITIQIDGGFKPNGKWYEKIEGGGGVGGGMRPLSTQKTKAMGTTLSLTFPGKTPVLKPADVKKLLAPILDFTHRSATENYFDSLPSEIQQAIKAKRAEIGMTKDQVLMALGQPRDRIRESKDGVESEDWIYGLPPGKISFVTFRAGKVFKLKDSFAGLGGSTAEAPRPVQ